VCVCVEDGGVWEVRVECVLWGWGTGLAAGAIMPAFDTLVGLHQGCVCVCVER
jgi:hypothetical protein